MRRAAPRGARRASRRGRRSPARSSFRPLRRVEEARDVLARLIANAAGELVQVLPDRFEGLRWDGLRERDDDADARVGVGVAVRRVGDVLEAVELLERGEELLLGDVIEVEADAVRPLDVVLPARRAGAVADGAETLAVLVLADLVAVCDEAFRELLEAFERCVFGLVVGLRPENRDNEWSAHASPSAARIQPAQRLFGE